MTGVLAGHAATTTFTPSKLTLVLLLGVFIGAIFKRFVVVAAVLVGLYLASHIPHVSFPADAVLVLVLVFAFVGFLFGGQTMLKDLARADYRTRFINIRHNINGIWGMFWGNGGREEDE
jgi:hypothetical protein